MPIMTRGLHVTQYMEDCFSMSSITIKFIDKERNAAFSFISLFIDELDGDR